MRTYEMIRAWSSPEPINDLTLFADWDGVVSMIFALREYAFVHGTVPTWNFMLCGGQPELAVPFSWAFTWPSLFAYALPPVHAILAVWIVLTVVGFVATRALLLRWTDSAPGSAVGACLYVLSGYFASHFNAGHVTFAFYHLVPPLMLAFEVAHARLLRGEAAATPLLLATLTAFLFFTAGIPHALLHFFPALLLLGVFRIAARARDAGLGRSLRAAALAFGAQLLGLWLAAYKLWPAIRWQLAVPRSGVRLESYTAWEVIQNTLIFVPDHFTPGQQPWHNFPSWAYGAYVGPAAWALALFALFATVWQHRTRGGAATPALSTTAFGLALVAVGINLSLGNDHPLSVAYLFRHLPILEGIRVFARYEVLVVFGLSVLVAVAFRAVTDLAGDRLGARVIRAGLALAVAAPVAAQSAFLIWNVGALPQWEIAASYEAADRPDPPELIGVMTPGNRGASHQTSLLARGYWIANCRSDLSLPLAPAVAHGSVLPLSSPPPVAIAALTRDTLTLRYAPPPRGPVRLNLRVLDTFRVDPPVRRGPGDAVYFRGGDLRDGAITLRASYPGPAEGALASLLGAAASVAFHARRRGSRAA